ncbi:8137_t:CDS:1, partial [Dentiscutata erythropus]
NPDNTIFVMNGTIGQAAKSQAKAFHEAADIGSIIITKIDGHAK